MTPPSELKLAGQLIDHTPLLLHMRDLKELLTLSRDMTAHSARVAVINADTVTLIGGEQRQTPVSGALFSTLAALKGHDAAEYAVTPDELRALNRHEVTRLGQSQELADLMHTLRGVAAHLHPDAPAPTETAPQPINTDEPAASQAGSGAADEPPVETRPSDSAPDIDLPADLTSPAPLPAERSARRRRGEPDDTAATQAVADPEPDTSVSSAPSDIPTPV